MKKCSASARIFQLFIRAVKLRAAAGVLQATCNVDCRLFNDGVGLVGCHGNRFIAFIRHLQLRFNCSVVWRR